MDAQRRQRIATALVARRHQHKRLLCQLSVSPLRRHQVTKALPQLKYQQSQDLQRLLMLLCQSHIQHQKSDLRRQQTHPQRRKQHLLHRRPTMRAHRRLLRRPLVLLNWMLQYLLATGCKVFGRWKACLHRLRITRLWHSTRERLAKPCHICRRQHHRMFLLRRDSRNLQHPQLQKR